MSQSAQSLNLDTKFTRDNRGAIAVLGIMLGTVLAAVLFHVVSIGFGVMWREAIQDAGDATAYEAAIWNARGMNVIVALNIFIAMVMAVLICWRMAILFMMGLTVIFSITCALESAGAAFGGGPPKTCQYPPLTGKAAEAMLKQDFKIAGRVYRIIEMLHMAQKVAAAAMPVMGTLSSIVEAKQYDVEFGVGFGPQLIPTLNYATAAAPLTSCVPALAKVDATANLDLKELIGKPVSLPWITSSQLNTLCEKAGRLQSKFLFYIIGKVGENFGLGMLKKLGDDPNSKWSKAWGSVTKKAAAFFCGDFMGIMGDLASDASTAAKKECNGDEKCEGEVDKGAKEGEAKSDPSALTIDNSNVVWADMWSGAKNGNLFMQSWSYVKSERRFLEPTDQGISLANLSVNKGGDGKMQAASAEGAAAPEDAGNPAGAAADTTTKNGSTLAQAEMFFDCTKEWQDGECVKLAPWAMRWRARLRRVHDPVDIIASDFQKNIVGALYAGLQGNFPGAVKDKFAPVLEKLQKNHFRLVQVQTSKEFQEQRDELAREISSDANGGAVRNAASWVKDEVAKGIPELIH